MLKHYNIKQLLKNIFIFNRQVVIITNCNKSKGLNGRTGSCKVAWFLPKSLSWIIVVYIMWLLPFKKVLYRLGGICRPKQLALISGVKIKAWLTVLSYWHMAIEIDLKAAKANSNNKVANLITDRYQAKVYTRGGYRLEVAIASKQLIIILLIEGGKSIFFMLLAFIKDK
ncbi:unnamed protein product [Fusarium fujikuroi]|uniref:Transmembrane protein n=1 Tax=Fusarium fujikuroi TaxID=5127 RepID=A0A9Q9RGI1_FUSFU|nr:unnamed protein product [Fusarium fujikuroi]